MKIDYIEPEVLTYIMDKQDMIKPELKFNYY